MCGCSMNKKFSLLNTKTFVKLRGERVTVFSFSVGSINSTMKLAWMTISVERPMFRGGQMKWDGERDKV